MTFMLSLVLHAQIKVGPVSITHGEEIEADKENIVRIAGEANGKIYTLATKGKNFFIKVFNSEAMDLVSTNEIEMPDFIDKEPNFEDFFVINDKVFILGSVYDKKNKIYNLLAVEVDKDGKLTDNKKKLFSTKVTKKGEKGAFYFKQSPDGNNLLIMHASLFEKEEVMQYEIKLINQDLDIMAEHIEKVTYEDRRDLEFTISDFDVSINEDIFLVINESYRDKKKKQNIEKFEIHAFKKSNDYQKETVNIDFTGKEVINCQILANQNNKVELVGFYSSVRKNGKANKELKGIYVGIVDAVDNSVESLKFNEFDYETKVKLIGERRAKKGKDLKPLYVPHTLIEKEDGGLLFLSEYKQIIVGRSSGIGPIAFQPIIYVNNEIIVTSLGADGQVQWTNVIAKEQKAAFTAVSLGLFVGGGNSNFAVTASVAVPIGVLGKGPEYLSALPIYEDGELTVIFNDNIKNVGVTDIEKIKSLGNYNKAVPTAFVFDGNTGAITRIDSDEVKDNQLILRPGVFYRESPKDYIIYSSRKSQDRLGRMHIE